MQYVRHSIIELQGRFAECKEKERRAFYSPSALSFLQSSFKVKTVVSDEGGETVVELQYSLPVQFSTTALAALASVSF